MYGPCPISPPMDWGSQKPPVGVPIDRGHPLAQGLIAYWLMNEGAGCWLLDVSGNNRNGTASGCTWVATQRGLCLDFNGTTDLVNCGAEFIGASACSIAAWAYLDSYGEGVGSNYSGRVIDNGKLLFYVFSPNTNIQFSSDGGTTLALGGTGGVAIGSWYYITATRTAAGVANLYVNGVLSGTANQSSGTPTAGSNNVVIGNNLATTRSFDGRIDGVSIYNRVLSAAEVAQLYRQPYRMFEAGGPLAAPSSSPVPLFMEAA
jgi:hypothetical protein